MHKKKRKWPKVVAMVLVLTVLVGAVSLVLVEKFAPEQQYLPGSVVALPSKAVSLLISPFQRAFSWASQGIADYLQRLKLQKALEIEYNKLKLENDELVYRSLRLEELERDYEALRAQIDNMTPEIERLNPLSANVIAKEAGNWFQTFTINVGKDHGVELNMAVITADGLVGEITQVFDKTSEVTTIIDSRSSIAAMIQSSRDQGVVQGTLGIDDQPTCRMYYLPVDLTTRPNEVVVTSGVGVSFPKGLIIGKVRESTRYQDQNKHYVVIEPAVDFRHIERVMVLLYETDVEQIDEGRDGQAAYTPVTLDTMRPIKKIDDQLNDANLGGFEIPSRPDEFGTEAATMPPTYALPLPDDVLLDGETPHPPGATPTPNPELDEEIRAEQEADLGGP